jgi:hypothetical protein
MKNEPVMTVDSIVAAIMGIVTFLVTMGAISWSPEQVSAFQAMIIATLPIALILGAGWYKRSKVVPLAKLEEAEELPAYSNKREEEEA